VVKLGRILHSSCQHCTLDERDAVIDALRPLAEQRQSSKGGGVTGWKNDQTNCPNSPAAA